MKFISISQSERPLFTELGKMTDADKGMNPQHLGINPIVIRI